MVQKRLSCKYIAKLIAICEGIQIYPVYSVEACRATFYPICFRYVDADLFGRPPNSFILFTVSFCILFLGRDCLFLHHTTRPRHRFSEQKLRLSIFFSVPVTFCQVKEMHQTRIFRIVRYNCYFIHFTIKHLLKKQLIFAHICTFSILFNF